MPDSLSLTLGICAAADFLLGGSGVALLAYIYTHFAGFGVNGMFIVIAALPLVLGGLVLAVPVAVLAVLVALRRRDSWVATVWMLVSALTAAGIYLVMFAPLVWRQGLGVTGESHQGTLRGTAVAGIALLLPLGAIVYGFWRRVPSHWVPVGCAVAGMLLAACLVITR